MAAIALVITAIADLASGQAMGVDEALHLVALAGATVLAWQSRTIGTGSAGPAIVTAAPAASDRPGRRRDGHDRSLADRRDGAQRGRTADPHDEAVA
jgi:hypothetical protein